jgi:hypothetical protein
MLLGNGEVRVSLEIPVVWWRICKRAVVEVIVP